MKASKSDRTGAEELRLIVRNMDNCNESFNDRFTAEELIKIGRAWLASEWDISPDEWHEEQVQDALKGIPPKFCEPWYGDSEWRCRSGYAAILRSKTT